MSLTFKELTQKINEATTRVELKIIMLDFVKWIKYLDEWKETKMETKT